MRLGGDSDFLGKEVYCFERATIDPKSLPACSVVSSSSASPSASSLTGLATTMRTGLVSIRDEGDGASAVRERWLVGAGG